MEVISRDYITPDLVYKNYSQTYTYENLVDNIKFWKIILYEEYGMRPGMSIALVDQAVKFSYCSLFFAAAELGLKILIFPEKSERVDGYSAKLESVVAHWGLVDLIYYDDMVTKTPALLAMCHRYGRQTVQEQVFFNYNIKDPKLFNEISNKVFANPEDVLVWTATSGTTAAPKLLEYTHQQLYRIGERNSRVFDFKNQSIIHLRNMHHASVLMSNFLPGFRTSNNHYELIIDLSTDGTNRRLVEFIKSNQVSRVVIPWKTMLDSLLEYMIKRNIKFEHEIHIVVGGFYVTKNYIDIIKKTNIAKLISMYGSNETFGPILLKVVDQYTDKDTFVENYLGTNPDDFYQIELVDQKLQVTCSSIYNGTKTLDDLFSGNNLSGYTHNGRSNFYRINEVDFDPQVITQMARSMFSNPNIELVTDMPKQRLYIAVWEGKFNLLKFNRWITSEYPGLTVAAYDFLDRRNFEDFKIDYEGLRNHFRNRFNQ